MKWSDAELIAAYKSGNSQAFRQFYSRYKDALYTFLHNRCREEAEDLFQESFKRFIDAAAVRKLENPKAYLFQIAMNLLRNLGRKAKIVALSDEIELPAPEPEAAEMDEAVLKIALAELAKQKPLFYDVLHLHIFGKMTFEEIGKIKNISKDTSASRYRYAIHFLRKYMKNNNLLSLEVENA